MNKRIVLITACLIFFVMGLLSAAVGPSLENLADHTGRSLADLGGLITAIFFGSLITQIASGPVIDRWGQRPVMIAGIIMMSLGVSGVLLSPTLVLLMVCGVLFGLGFGSMDVSNNVMIAGQFSGSSVAMLNLSHLFFGIGSVIGPLLASLFLKLTDTATPALWVGAAVALLALPFISRLPARAQTADPDPADQDQPSASLSDLYRSPVLWVLGVLLMLYVGAEIGVGSWNTAYLEQTTSVSAATAALVTSGYWLALSGGRMAMVFLGGRFAAHTLLQISLIGSAAGGLLMAVSTGNLAFSVIAVLIMGFSFGPVYPIDVAIVTATFHRAPGRATSVVTAMSSGGGMILPWMQGMLMDRQGQSSSVIFIAGLTVAMLALHVGIMRARNSH